MATKTKSVLSQEQRRHLLDGIHDIGRRSFREDKKPESVIKAEKRIAADEKIVEAWKEKQCKAKCEAKKNRQRRQIQVIDLIYFPTSAEDALAAVDTFDHDFSVGWESGDCHC